MIFPLSDQGFGGATISTFCFVTTHMAVTMERDWQEKNGACEYLISWGSLDKGQLGLSCFSIRIQTKTDSQLTKNYSTKKATQSCPSNNPWLHETWCLSMSACRLGSVETTIFYHDLWWWREMIAALRISTIGVQMFLNTPTGFVIK